jgi:hypothetical protein
MKRRLPPISLFLWGLVALLLLARLHLLWVRVYDPDEFEHLHAGWSVARGLVWYRDFFEHHGPVTYIISSLLFRMLPESLDPLHSHRVLSLLFSIVTAAGIARLASRLYGRGAAAWSVLAALSYSLFVEKSVEWRPDGIATALLVWLACVAVGPMGFTFGWLAGCLAALTLLTTQKGVFIAGGILLASLFRGSTNGRMLARWIAGVIAGGCTIGGAAVGIFASQGCLMPALESLIARPLSWSIRIGGPHPLLSPFAWAPGHQVGLLAGLISLACQLGRRSSWRRGRFIPLAGLLAHGVGYFLAPAVYFQFYMLAVPLAAVVLAGEARRLARLARRRVSASIVGVSWLVIGLSWLTLGTIRLFSMFPSRVIQHFSWTPYAVLVVMGMVMLVSYWIARRDWMARVGYGCWVVALALPSLQQIANTHFYWPNRTQRDDIATLERLVPTHEAVLDGFTGLGYRRPHLSYWWWINEHTLPMMLQKGDDRQIVADVAHGKPGLILVDQDLQRLPGLESVIFGHYVLYDLAGDGLGQRPYAFFLRKDLVPKSEGRSATAPSGE